MASGSASHERFAHRRAGHCGSGALRDLLEFHGLDYGAGPISEGAAFALAGGLGFLYAELDEVVPPVYVVGRTGDMEVDVAEHLGVDLQIAETDDPDEGWSLVRDEIDAGRPPMVWADIGELEYLRVRMHNTRHDIVIVDYDEDEGVAWIADNDRDELQRCSLTSLAAARSSKAFPGPNRHRVYRYDWSGGLREPVAATRAAVERAVANMSAGGEALAGLPGWTGLAGVERFAARYPAWPSAFDDLEACMGGLRVFIVKAGTGGAMFRSLHADGLHDLAALLSDPSLESVASGYDELVAAWSALARAAADGDHAAGLAPVEAIARLEAEGVEAMRGWLS